MANVNEGGSVSVCAQMTTNPATATLGREVAVSLFTEDGTGKKTFLLGWILIYIRRL
jgi:hypothetical protein